MDLSCQAYTVSFNIIKTVIKQKGVLTQSWPLDLKNLSSLYQLRLALVIFISPNAAAPVLLFFMFFFWSQTKVKFCSLGSFTVRKAKNVWLQV